MPPVPALAGRHPYRPYVAVQSALELLARNDGNLATFPAGIIWAMFGENSFNAVSLVTGVLTVGPGSNEQMAGRATMLAGYPRNTHWPVQQWIRSDFKSSANLVRPAGTWTTGPREPPRPEALPAHRLRRAGLAGVPVDAGRNSRACGPAGPAGSGAHGRRVATVAAVTAVAAGVGSRSARTSVTASDDRAASRVVAIAAVTTGGRSRPTAVAAVAACCVSIGRGGRGAALTTVTAVDSAPSSSVATVTAGRERPCGTLGRSAAALTTTVACSSVIGVATRPPLPP